MENGSAHNVCENSAYVKMNTRLYEIVIWWCTMYVNKKQ